MTLTPTTAFLLRALILVTSGSVLGAIAYFFWSAFMNAVVD